MKTWMKQHQKQIIFTILMLLFVIQVLFVPSIRPFFYEGRNYYVTYRIDGNNIADAVVFIPLAFMGMGFFAVLLSFPHIIKTALLCALVPLPVVVRRMACWSAYSSILDNALYNICSFALGVLLAVFLRFAVIRTIRGSWMRYREKRNGRRNSLSSDIDSAVASPKSWFQDWLRSVLTHDTMLQLLSIAFPLMLVVLYSANIVQTSSVGIRQDEIDMTYMLFWIPLVFWLSGFLCSLANKPQYLSCCAALLLVSLDTIYDVFGIREFPDLSTLVIATAIYLLIWGVGIVIGSLIRRCTIVHREIRQRHEQ